MRIKRGRKPTLYTRTEAAAVVHVHPQSLIVWEQKNLINPKRDYRGWRKYTILDIRHLEKIAARNRHTGGRYGRTNTNGGRSIGRSSSINR